MVGLVVHEADVQDRDGALDVLRSVRHRYPWLRHVFADGGYAGKKLGSAEPDGPLDDRDHQAHRQSHWL